MEVKKRLFLGNLPDGASEKDIRKKFERFGSVSAVEIKYKKVNDGNESSTFAFVELSLSEDKFNECLRTTNGSEMGGLRVRVQPAKESFLSRLKAEREQSSVSNSKRPAVPQPPAQDYNPMQMFRSFKQSSVNESTDKTKPSDYNRTKPVAKVDFKSRQMDEQTSPVAKSGGLKKFGGTKSVMQPTKVEEDDLEEEGGNLMSKLESFSGMWNDMDEAPVLIETTKTKKRLEQASAPKSPVKLETETKPVPKVKEVDPEEAKKKELDNQKRIESLKQRNEALKAQHNLIKSALSLGQQNNRKIKFEDVDPEPEADRGRPKKSKKKQLFDEEELMEELGDEETWKLRPHLDGQTGQELLELQSRYGNDARFKLDHRFTETDGTDEPKGDDDEHVVGTEEEKQRQMSILGSLVPLAPSNSASAGTDSAKNRLGNKAFVRFDPNVKDHVKFVKTAEKGTSDSTETKGGRHRKEIGEAPPSQPLPEVSSERYYTTTGTIDIGKSSGGFSLRQLFQRPDAEEPEEEKEKTAKVEEVVKATVSAIQPVKNVGTGQTGYWKNTGMWHEPLFLQPEDGRFKEALDFLKRKPSEEAYKNREKWAEYRDRLRYFYRNKTRRLTSWTTTTTTTTGPKRPAAMTSTTSAVDAEQSSFHFYQHPSAESVEKTKKQKMRSHRSFYKR